MVPWARVAGICGGYQILGRQLADEAGVEGPPGRALNGLGLLPVNTVFASVKQTYQASLRLADGHVVQGYEIHMGATTRLDGAQPLGRIIRRGTQTVQVDDGAKVEDARIWGTYLHGIFEDEAFRRGWLQRLGWRHAGEDGAQPVPSQWQAYDRLADAVESATDWARIMHLLELV